VKLRKKEGRKDRRKEVRKGGSCTLVSFSGFHRLEKAVTVGSVYISQTWDEELAGRAANTFRGGQLLQFLPGSLPAVRTMLKILAWLPREETLWQGC
jgi:hypothetical protein